jgi:carboxymethylenebutenolidase
MNDLASARQTLSSVWQQHTHAEFVLKDADAALATMVDEPYVLCIPSGTGGAGRAEVHDYYARQFLPKIPPDLELIPLSQVFGGDRLVEEFVVRFTHTLAMDWMLPGVVPTGRKVEFAMAAVVGFRDGRISHEHLHWDQTAVLSQLALLDHPVARAGVTSAARLLKLSEGYGVC